MLIAYSTRWYRLFGGLFLRPCFADGINLLLPGHSTSKSLGKKGMTLS